MRRTAVRVGAAGLLLALLLVPGIAWAGETEQFQKELAERGFLLTLLSSFGLGLAASLTPCVYPMIPIVVGVFGARDEAVTRRKAFALATAYVLGMAVIFTSLGILFALIGKAGDQGTVLAKPAVVIPLVLVYVALAASMFGAFELNLPAGVQQRLARVGGKGYGGAFGMGMVGGFTAAPCTGPFLAGMLGWVAVSGDVMRGASMLLAFSLGMGVLFWVIAATSVSLPKSGRWMEWVKSAGGIALLVVAIYFLRPIVPALEQMGSSSLVLLAAGAVLVVAGVLVGAIHLSFFGGAAERARKTAGVLLTVVGSVAVMSWALTPDRTLPWRTDDAAAFAEAKASGKGVMIDFSADWCKPCGKLETDTFAAAGVYEAILDGYVPVKFDVTDDTELDEARKEKYGQSTMPEVILLDADGTVLERIHEFVGPTEFMKVLRRADEARRKQRVTSAGSSGAG